MVNAYIFTKDGDSTSGLVHTFSNEDEAWDWVSRQDTVRKNVVVANDADIMTAWRLFGANRGNDDTERVQTKQEVDAD